VRGRERQLLGGPLGPRVGGARSAARRVRDLAAAEQHERRAAGAAGGEHGARTVEADRLGARGIHEHALDAHHRGEVHDQLAAAAARATAAGSRTSARTKPSRGAGGGACRAGRREVVEREHVAARARQRRAQTRADEAGAAGDERTAGEAHGVPSTVATRRVFPRCAVPRLRPGKNVAPTGRLAPIGATLHEPRGLRPSS